VLGIKIPATYKEAVNDPEYSQLWKQAIIEELRGHYFIVVALNSRSSSVQRTSFNFATKFTAGSFETGAAVY
jgi:hypothetical protein